MDRPRLCLECPLWYGAEDDEFGPCSVKNHRKEKRFVTYGSHACDEGFRETTTPPVPPLEA